MPDTDHKRDRRASLMQASITLIATVVFTFVVLLLADPLSIQRVWILVFVNVIGPVIGLECATVVYRYYRLRNGQ